MNDSAQLAFTPDAALLERVLPAYIAAQRWFGGKSRGIRSARLNSSMPLAQTSSALCLIEVTHNHGDVSLYQLPLAAASASEADAIKAHSLHSVITALDERSILYDATASADFRAALLRSILYPPQEKGAAFAASHTATDLTSLLAQPSRVSSAEQSNTSILCGDQAILKLYRHVQWGENPDVEVSRFLTNAGHFRSTPAYLGDLHLASDNTTLAFLQAFAANQGDGWQWTLSELARFYACVANIPAPLVHSKQPADLKQYAGSYLDAAELLGHRTAEMHLSLATPTNDPAFSTERFTAQDIGTLRTNIRAQTDEAFSALQSALPNLPAESRILAAQLLTKHQQLSALTTGLTGNPAAFGARLRIHGDYHLGQLLRTANDFLIVDFEGEPARSLDERRRKHSPLKDVAGMLRSFSYAAHAALPQQSNNSALWASLWEVAVSNAFLFGYHETLTARPDLLPQPEQVQALLLALLLEKALYELLYELNNRPAWLPLPLTGLLALAHSNSSTTISWPRMNNAR